MHGGPAVPAPLDAYLDAAIDDPLGRTVHDAMMAIGPILAARFADG